MGWELGAAVTQGQPQLAGTQGAQPRRPHLPATLVKAAAQGSGRGECQAGTRPSGVPLEPGALATTLTP